MWVSYLRLEAQQKENNKHTEVPREVIQVTEEEFLFVNMFMGTNKLQVYKHHTCCFFLEIHVRFSPHCAR